MKKKTMFTEAAYLLGILTLALGTALMERADFGMSMVVAPAYLVYLKVSEVWSAFTFGMAEYCFQALLLVILSLVLKRFQKSFLCSFVTAFFYGNVLDLMMKLIGLIPDLGVAGQILFFLGGMVICSVGVSLLFHTYITPEAYELFVKEMSVKLKKDIHLVKTIYDCCSCLIAILMSFLFIGFLKFEGVKWGTVFCALVNGALIGLCSKGLEKLFDFKDAWNFRKFFES